MTDSNNYARPLYYYQQPENQQFLPSNTYIRNNQDPFTPQHSRISNIELPNTQFVPKIIESGYIVGPPIAYTQAPTLPPNFTAFSPAKMAPLHLDSSTKQPFDGSSSKLVINHPSHVYPSSIS